MSEIKPANERLSDYLKTLSPRLNQFAIAHIAETVLPQFQIEEAAELRAAYEALQKENEAQAKRIAELEEHVTKLGSGSRQHLYQAFARRYKEILSLRRENEALHKQVDEHKEWHMMRDEMRKALEAQMNGEPK